MTRKYRTRVVELTDEELQRQLRDLETAYCMTSSEFLDRYNSGDLGDGLPFIRWAGLLRTAAKAGPSLTTHA